MSTLVASGEINRNQALEEMGNDVYGNNDLEQDRDFVIKKLGLTEDEFEAIMTAPVKKHADYPSNSFVFNDLKGLKRVFKRIATGNSVCEATDKK